MYYLRKIERGKWPGTKNLPEVMPHDISADAITSDLRTTGNTLSLWMIHDDKELEDAFLSLGAKMQSFEKIDAIQIPEEYLKDFTLQNEIGDSPIASIRDNHRNIVELNYDTIGSVSMMVCKCLEEERVVRRSRAEMKKMYQKAYQKGRLDSDKMSARLWEKLEEMENGICNNGHS